jgi:hypothetical protein
MADREKIVLIPRYTSFVGLGTFYLPPVRVRDFCSADISFWRGVAMGTGLNLLVKIEESPDLSLWRDLATFGTTAAVEFDESMEFTTDWIRAGVFVIGGTAVAFSAWMVGEFERRETTRGR